MKLFTEEIDRQQNKKNIGSGLNKTRHDTQEKFPATHAYLWYRGFASIEHLYFIGVTLGVLGTCILIMGAIATAGLVATSLTTTILPLAIFACIGITVASCCGLFFEMDKLEMPQDSLRVSAKNTPSDESSSEDQPAAQKTRRCQHRRRPSPKFFTVAESPPQNDNNLAAQANTTHSFSRR